MLVNKPLDLSLFLKAISVGSSLWEPVDFILFFLANRKKEKASMDSSRNHTFWHEHSGGKVPAGRAGDVSVISSRQTRCSRFRTAVLRPGIPI